MLLLNRTWPSDKMSLLPLHDMVVTSGLPADLSVASPLAHLGEKAATEERPTWRGAGSSLRLPASGEGRPSVQRPARACLLLRTAWAWKEIIPNGALDKAQPWSDPDYSPGDREQGPWAMLHPDSRPPETMR